MQNSFIAYVDDEYVSEDKAKISVFDLGLTRGYGIFDFFRTYQGFPFYFEDHYDRLVRSATMLHLKLSITPFELKTIINNLMKKNKQKEAAVKIILTAGKSIHGLELNQKPTFIVLTLPLPFYSPEYFSSGVKLISKIHKPYLPTCKTLNYIPALLAMQDAKEKNAFEVLFIDEDQNILEGATSNFFAFKNDKLITPNENIMLGITRKVILKLAEKEFEIEKRAIKKAEIKTFDEAFISASNKEIMPVYQIDDTLLKIGPNTKKIMHLFKEYTQKLLWLKENSGVLRS
jgi:branched-chain amino acid aminotransferase